MVGTWYHDDLAVAIDPFSGGGGVGAGRHFDLVDGEGLDGQHAAAALGIVGEDLRMRSQFESGKFLVAAVEVEGRATLLRA